ncbi:hypothetical protein TNCV_2959981, partial [Trichonephila clavipes]
QTEKSLSSQGKLHLRNENEVRELTSEILTAHGYASKPVTHSEVPFVQGELKHLFKERNRARKRQQVWEEHLPLWILRTDPFGNRQSAFRSKAAPDLSPNGPYRTHKDEYITNTVDAYFNANTNNTEQIPPALPSEILPECLEDCSGGPDSQTWERSPLAESHRAYFLTPILSKLAENHFHQTK